MTKTTWQIIEKPMLWSLVFVAIIGIFMLDYRLDKIETQKPVSVPQPKWNAPACAWWCEGEPSSLVSGNEKQMLEMCAHNCRRVS